MLRYDKNKGGFILPIEEAERIEQAGITARLSCELLDAYGNTPQVRRIIAECMRSGFPRSLFECGGNGRF